MRMNHNGKIRGISFTANIRWGSILFQILDKTNYDTYYWNITEDQILDNEIMDYITFNEIINGKELKQFLEQKRNYSVISINAKASYIPYNKAIYSYEDFLQSPFTIILLCADDVFYEIYSKDMEFLKRVKENAIKNNFSNIEYITAQNDGRIYMSVM